MPRVTGEAFRGKDGKGKQEIEVWYGPRFTTKTYDAALEQVKGFMEAVRDQGCTLGKMLHYPDDKKKCTPEEIPFSG